jgi:predicted RNase H-like HicB family nuclease
MHYPIAIEIGSEDIAYGVVVPDLPGCFSAGDTLDEAMTNAEEAAIAWIEVTLDDGASVPAPSSLEAVRANPEYKGWSFGVVNVNPAALDTTSERVNIILPRRVLLRLDASAKAHGESRSGYVAHLAMADCG